MPHNSGNAFNKRGTYLCRNCGIALFDSKDKFSSGTGWPSFDREIPGKVKKLLDSNGVRTELLCNRCEGHLGHIFFGEGFTNSNSRYCINSLALEFVEYNVLDTEEIILAAGCFWGVEYLFKKLKGILKTEVGYIGGHVNDPTYQLVCTEKTEHLEAMRVLYDPEQINFEHIIQFFFEIHDFTQMNGQGIDVGSQYLSKIFYYNQQQYQQALDIIKILQIKGYAVATELVKITTFWPAEEYHQEYYSKTKSEPYCHIWKKIF